MSTSSIAPSLSAKGVYIILVIALVITTIAWICSIGWSLDVQGDRSSLMTLFQLAAAFNFVAMAYVEKRREMEHEINKTFWTIKNDVDELIKNREEQESGEPKIRGLASKLLRAKELKGSAEGEHTEFKQFQSNARYRDISMLLFSAGMFLASIAIILLQAHAPCEYTMVDFLIAPALLSPCLALVISRVERYEMREKFAKKLTKLKSSRTRMMNSYESGN